MNWENIRENHVCVATFGGLCYNTKDIGFDEKSKLRPAFAHGFALAKRMAYAYAGPAALWNLEKMKEWQMVVLGIEPWLGHSGLGRGGIHRQ